MSKVEMVRLALARLGEHASITDLTTEVQRLHGVTLPPAVIPVIRATLRDRQMLDRFRQEARALIDKAAADSAERKGASRQSA